MRGRQGACLILPCRRERCVRARSATAPASRAGCGAAGLGLRMPGWSVLTTFVSTLDTRNWVWPCPYKGHHRQRLHARRRWLRDGCAPACNRRNACNLTSTSNRQVLSTGRYAPTAAGRCGLRVSCAIWRTTISAALSAQSASTIKPWLCSSDKRRKKT